MTVGRSASLCCCVDSFCGVPSATVSSSALVTVLKDRWVD
jgi:hypothetical protein